MNIKSLIIIGFLITTPMSYGQTIKSVQRNTGEAFGFINPITYAARAVGNLFTAPAVAPTISPPYIPATKPFTPCMPKTANADNKKQAAKPSAGWVAKCYGPPCITANGYKGCHPDPEQKYCTPLWD